MNFRERNSTELYWNKIFLMVLSVLWRFHFCMIQDPNRYVETLLNIKLLLNLLRFGPGMWRYSALFERMVSSVCTSTLFVPMLTLCQSDTWEQIQLTLNQIIKLHKRSIRMLHFEKVVWKMWVILF